MKFYLCVFLVMMSTLSIAGNSTRIKEWETSKTTEEIIKIMSAVDTLCQNGCAYYMPSVTRAQVVNQNADTLVYWTYVNSIVDVSFFSIMKIQKKSDHTLLESNMLSFDEARPYAASSQLNHAPGPMHSNALMLEIKDLGSKRQIKATLSASGGAIVTSRRLAKELNNSLNAYSTIL